MKENIISQKIRRELTNLPIDTEPRVMYLLVEIRKVLEHENIKSSALGFYCDWVVHTKLDRSYASSIYDEVSNNTHEGLEMISFRKLKEEMHIFLQTRNLPTELLVDDNWKLFRDNLIEILIDIPIQKMVGGITGSLFFQKRDNKDVAFYFVYENEGIVKELGEIL